MEAALAEAHPRAKLRLGELFAGYGGLGIAVNQVFDSELAWYAEFDQAPSKIMAHNYPGLTNYGDVTTIDWSSVPKVDIISGGSPCQDLSLSGKRGGMVEGTRSNLWVAMREAIATIKPTYVIWENVRGALSAKASSSSSLEQPAGLLGATGGPLRALGRVLGDLADLGYDAQWHSLRASDIGAPHARLRVFILATLRTAAHPVDLGRDQSSCSGLPPQIPGIAHRAAPAAHSDSQRHHRRLQLPQPQRQCESAHRSHPDAHNVETNWGKYEPAIRRWEHVVGQAPGPTEPNLNGNERLTARFTEWMMGLSPGWTTQVPGVTRRQMIKACGNGVVPQQASAALRHMLDVERMLATSWPTTTAWSVGSRTQEHHEQQHH